MATLKKYMVISPEIYHPSYSWLEPSEYGCCVVEVEAYTKRQAVNAAIQTSQFREWVSLARSDGYPPQKDLEVIEVDKLGEPW